MIRWLGEYYERPMYALTSGLALVVMGYFWRCTDALAWTLPEWTLWPMRTLLVGTLAWQVWCTSIVGPRHLIGMTQLKAARLRQPVRDPEFRLKGPYRVIRHPIAASQVVMMWVATAVYADRLLLAAVWTLWIVGSTALEDRRLGTQYGQKYAEYRQHAGFLFPRWG
jgi:protein-S-isoprenylcysteine O-methyltransferase Ste14